MVCLLCSVSATLVAQESMEKTLKEKALKEKEEQVRVEAREREHARVAYGVASAGRAQAAPTVSSSYSTGDGFFFTNALGGSSSQISLSKTFHGESKKNEGAFDVDNTVRIITLSLSGDVKEGEIKIIISLPDGKKLKEMTIDESANIQFNQTIKISEEEKKYYGKWKYNIEAVKAIGSYRLGISTR